MKFIKLTILSVILLCTQIATSQSINSPYSGNGLGELLFQGLPHNYGMGEVGIAMPTVYHINLQNPALLTYNTLSTYQVGLVGDFRNYESNLGTASDNSAGLRFLALSFPVVNRYWTTAFSLNPLSEVNYNTFSIDSLDDSTQGLTQLQGNGGLSKLAWSNGVRIYKSLSIGVNASYIFGTIDRLSRIQLSTDNEPPAYLISYQETTNYSDFNLSMGAAYKQKLKENQYLNLGLTYDLSRNLEGRRDEFFERLTNAGTPVGGQLITEDAKTEFTLPNSIGLGLSYEILNKVKIGFDLVSKNWENVNNESSSIALRNTLKMSLGGEFIPDYQSVNNYFQRATYRFGVTYNQLPYLVNDTEINDFGINFGASFPVSGFSSLDAAFKFGLRGTTDSNLIRENYFQVVIGATINDRWFIKRRYD